MKKEMIGGNVTRTNRNIPVNRYPMRNPRTYSEKSQLEGILNDPDLKDLPVNKVNRMRSRRGEKVPDMYSDIMISAYYEIFAKKRRQRD